MDLKVEHLQAITSVKALHFLFETEQMAYEQMMALSPLKRSDFQVKCFLALRETNNQSVYYQLVCKPYIFDDNGNPWLALVTTHRLPAKHNPQIRLGRTFSHTPIPLKEKKEKNIMLTAFQIDIIELAHDGFTSEEIAGKLNSTKDTISNTRKKILRKLGVKNTHEAYELARKLGLLNKRSSRQRMERNSSEE